MSYFGEVMEDGPAAYWRLGEASGAQAADSSPNGRHGAWSGSPALGAGGALDMDADKAALLDGVDDKVTLPALPPIGTTLTLEFWFKPQPGGDATQLVVGEAGGSSGIYFKAASQKLSVFYSAADHMNDTPLAWDTWHHICIVFNAGSGTFYLNATADGTFASFPSGFAPDRIGDDTSGNTYKGYLDEVALYLSVLAETRIGAHYAAAWRGLLGLRPRLRRELHDEDAANYRWSDAELDRHITRAADALSEAWPDEKKTVMTTTPGSRDLSMAGLDHLVRVEAVEHPTGAWPPEYIQFQTWGQTLTLLTESAPAGPEPVNVFWGRRHQVERLTSTVPQVAEEVLLLGASAYALLEQASFAVNRINVTGPGTEGDYKRQGEERLARFRRQLRRFGDAGRVRASQLYAPARAAPSKATVSFG